MKNILFLFSFMLVSSIAFSQGITIDESLTTQELIEDVLINSDCAEVSNFIASTGTNFGDVNGIGSFTTGDADFPFEAGIVLTSGNVLSAAGPNVDDALSEGDFFGWPGDADLEANTSADNTFNASFIQFDFTPFVSEISFDFMMASEEYEQGFECAFSDAFAFILTDVVAGTSENLAVVPGTTTPIEVTNIHPDVPGQCGAINEEFFGRYNFEPFNPAADSAIEFNGQTTVMTAMASVTVGTAYTIKLVVADQTDNLYDMAVFLGANSFEIGQVDLGDDILLDGGEATCEGDIVTLDAGQVDNASYAWTKDGVIIEGETSTTLDVSETGLYGVEITLGDGKCTATDDVRIEFFDFAEIDLGEDQLFCEDQSIVLDASPTNPDQLDSPTFQWFNNGTEVAGETNPTFEAFVTGVYSVEVTSNGCVATDEVTLTQVLYTVDIGDFIEPCGDADYEIVPVIEGYDTTDASYEWSTGETTPTITVTEDGTYSVIVTIEGCIETDDVTINFRTIPAIDFLLGTSIIKCAADIVTLDATPTNIDPTAVVYTWFLDGGLLADESGSSINVTEEGTYVVEVSDDGCIGTADLFVEFYANEGCVITQGISPNNDDQNESLDLTFLDDNKDITRIAIFNRLGGLVYEKDDYINEWIGQTTDGEELPVGTYYYVIELQTESPVTGWVYLNK